MNINELAVNKRAALRMFWDAGHTTEQQLIAARNKLESMKQPSKGYWYASDVSRAIGESVRS
jgi:hypothetical protein